MGGRKVEGSKLKVQEIRNPNGDFKPSEKSELVVSG
jgi:hypothetical protein